ncbi:MAG: CotH kinase family protein [Bacteroidaceae bacterium]|nr:CotH kinase family protein [Bacteroidaceae bacterium]
MKETTTCRLSFLLFVLLASTILHAYNPDVDHLLEGTLIYSDSSSKAALAFDGDASTYYSTSGSEMQWVGLDLGEPYVITRVGYTPAPGGQGADRAQLSLFEGANSPDFMDAMPLYFISEKPTNGTATTADVNVSRGFRYVRYVGGAGSYCNIAELQFYGHAGEGDDSQFYQITNLPTLSIHVQNNIKPTNRGEDFESQSVLIYDGGTMVQEYPILFRVRGNFSAAPENKAYRVKFNDGKSHHMMKGGHNESPVKAKKWVLINSYRDKTLMRNPVAWAMSKRGEKEWTPWSQIVDLVVNGDYRGTYTLADHISVTKGRIDITEMAETDIDGESVTGGYYVEVDNNASREPYWFNSSLGNPITIHEPDEDVMQPEQFQYIKDTWNNMESIVFGSNYTDPENGFRSVVDLESFLKWFLISEFNGNTDMICQVFMFKERGDDHFYTGPVWDAELALENDQTTYPANNRYDWTYKVRQTGNWSQFVSRILSDPSAFASLQEMWARLRKSGAFNPDDVAADVDSLRNEVRASANLNFIRWPYLTQHISLNPEVPGSWEKEVDRVRDYVKGRVEWMDYMLSYGLHKKNGIYQIASAVDLITFGQLVNESGETNARAVLLNDIDMMEYNENFHPIGTSSNIFAGSFDGMGHTIRNLYISGGDALGFFGHIGNCTLSNMVFDATCKVEGENDVGMLAGYAHDDCATLSGIENHGSVTATGNSAGAFLGYGNEFASVSIINSSNTGSITAQSNAAAFVGPFAGKMTVRNSYNIGTISGVTEGKEFAFATKSLSNDNCWDYTSMQTNNMTAEQVDNGYLCYQINYNDDTGSSNWRQNLDNGREHDPWPVRCKTSGRVYEGGEHYTNYNAEAVRYRYYNLVITALKSGNCLQFSEFDILDDTSGEVADLTIYDGPEGYNGEGYENATDNNVNTKYCGSFNGYSYFLFDAMDDVEPWGYRIYTANDTQNNPGRNPCSWKLYGSDTQLTAPDDPDWVLLDEHKNDNSLPSANYTPTDFVVPKPVKSLTLSKQSATLLPSEQLQLEVRAANVNLHSLTLQWITTNEAVATVDGNGIVVATGLGKADIIVYAQEDKSLRDTCTITVVKERLGYRYYQFAIDETAGGTAIQLSEIDFLDKDGAEIKPLTLYSYTGSHYSNEAQVNLFDDDVSTKYCGPFSPIIYLFIDAGREVTLSGYRLTTANDTKRNPGRNPVTWSLLGSNVLSEDPNDSEWTLLDRRENDNTLGAANYEPYDFIITYPQPVIIMAQNQTMVYGDILPDLSFTVDGTELVGTPTITCEANASSPVGIYPIIVSKGTVENKDVIYMSGELTITQAPLTVTTQYAEREVGEANPDFMLVYSGWKNGEDESVLEETPVATTSATTSSPVGEYPVTLSGGKARNYEFVFVDGVLVVTESDAIHAVLGKEGPYDVYTPDGRKIRHQVTSLKDLPGGLNIIRMSDGTVRKVLIK